MSAVIFLSLLLLGFLVGDAQGTNIKVLEGDGGSCDTDGCCDKKDCSLEGSVNKDKDREFKIYVQEADTYIRIETNVTKQEENPATVVFVLRTEVSVKTWRISSRSSGDSLEYSATLLPTKMANSTFKLVISTRSDGKCCHSFGREGEISRVIFQLHRTTGSSSECWKERKLY